MPQAPEHLRIRMYDRFGSMETEGPERYLRGRGWTLHPNWSWSKPGVYTMSAMPQDEYECMLFLMQEWDYGGILGEAGMRAVQLPEAKPVSNFLNRPVEDLAKEDPRALDILRISGRIVEEVIRARRKHPGHFHTPHEAYAVLLEEVDELWDEVKADRGAHSEFGEKEAIQVGAMAIRYVLDVCLPPVREEDADGPL